MSEEIQIASNNSLSERNQPVSVTICELKEGDKLLLLIDKQFVADYSKEDIEKVEFDLQKWLKNPKEPVSLAPDIFRIVILRCPEEA